MGLYSFLEKINLKINNIQELKNIEHYDFFKKNFDFKKTERNSKLKVFEKLKEKYDDEDFEFKTIETWNQQFILDEKIKKFSEKKDISEKAYDGLSSFSMIVNQEDVESLIKILEGSDQKMVAILRDLKNSFDFKNNTLFYQSYR